jgi:hypothetical protein
MHSSREEESFVLSERCASKLVHEDLRNQEQECLSFNGEGLLPGLTKAFRASKIVNHSVAPT